MMNGSDEQWMRDAIAAARQGIQAGQTPFGAAVVRNGTLVVAAHNQVWAGTDPTAHAEVQAIRSACGKLGTIDLGDTVMYATTEPCPMCYAAIHWARIPRIVYGASIADAARAGFNEMDVSNQALKDLSASSVELVAGVLKDECAGLFDEWARAGRSGTY